MGLPVQIHFRSQQQPGSSKVVVGSDPHALDEWLRNRVGRGNSAREAAAIARAAALSGASTSVPLDVENASRDFIREGKKTLQCQWGLWSEKTHVCRARNTCSEEVQRHVLLPHEFMSKLYQWDRGRFDYLMGIGRCADFWHNVSAHNPEWFTSHPAHDAIMKDTHLHNPVRLSACRRWRPRQIALLECSPLDFDCDPRTRDRGLQNTILMVQADATMITDLTFQPLHSVIAWSFNCALTGSHPRRGP